MAPGSRQMQPVLLSEPSPPPPERTWDHCLWLLLDGTRKLTRLILHPAPFRRERPVLRLAAHPSFSPRCWPCQRSAWPNEPDDSGEMSLPGEPLQRGALAWLAGKESAPSPTGTRCWP